jgi:hypothetical protein
MLGICKFYQQLQIASDPQDGEPVVAGHRGELALP